MANSNLDDVVQDAQRLLQYASEKGIDVPQALVHDVVVTQALIGEKVSDPATFPHQELLWLAIGNLTKLTMPATADSVRHSTATTGDWWRTWWFRITRWNFKEQVLVSSIELAVRRARFWALIGLGLVAVLQAYYEVGESTVKKYHDAQDAVLKEREKRKVRADALKPLEASQRDKLDATQKVEMERLLREQGESGVKISSESAANDRRIDWMKKMLVWREWPGVTSDEIEGKAQQAHEVLTVLGGLLTILKDFALPIAWSFLGAALYVSRALAEDIRTMAYAPERAILHRSRYYMGMVAGFVAAKLFPASVETGALSAVGSFALALLVGYSVEVLFALLDKLISAFSSK